MFNFNESKLEVSFLETYLAVNPDDLLMRRRLQQANWELFNFCLVFGLDYTSLLKMFFGKN